MMKAGSRSGAGLFPVSVPGLILGVAGFDQTGRAAVDLIAA